MPVNESVKPRCASSSSSVGAGAEVEVEDDRTEVGGAKLLVKAATLNLRDSARGVSECHGMER